MKTEPAYISRAQRGRAAWAKTGELLGLPGEIVREIYLDRYFCGVQASDFHALVARGKFTREKLLEHTSVEEVQAKIDAREASRVAKGDLKIDDEDIDCGDRINFHCKGVLQVGDEWEAGESHTYLSGPEYITKGRRYQITSFKDEGFGEFGITTKTNFPKPDDTHWTSSHAIRRLFREGKLVWDWKAAYILDWNAHHPEKPYPVTAEDLALFAELGWPAPCSAGAPISCP